MNEPCIGPDDTSFGPVIAVCRRTFDFTVLFEQVILSLLPSVVFILLALAQIASSWNAPAVAKRGHHYKWKLVSCGVQFRILPPLLTIAIDPCRLR